MAAARPHKNVRVDKLAPKCSSCERMGADREGVNSCKECGEVLCQICTGFHKALKAMSGHTIIALKDGAEATDEALLRAGSMIGKMKVSPKKGEEKNIKTRREADPGSRAAAASCGPAPEKPRWTWPVTRLAEYTSLPESGGNKDHAIILPGPWTRAALQYMSDRSQPSPGRVPRRGAVFPAENCNDVYCVRREFLDLLMQQFGGGGGWAPARLDSLHTQNPMRAAVLCSQKTSYASDVMSAIKAKSSLPSHDHYFGVLLDRCLPLQEAYSRLRAAATHKLQHVVSASGQLLDLGTPLQAYMSDQTSGVTDYCDLYVQYKWQSVNC